MPQTDGETANPVQLGSAALVEVMVPWVSDPLTRGLQYAQSVRALESQPVPPPGADRSVVWGRGVPTCSASFHSLWGYSSRKWGQEERREHQTDKNQEQTTHDRHRDKTTQQLKMG